MNANKTSGALSPRVLGVAQEDRFVENTTTAMDTCSKEDEAEMSMDPTLPTEDEENECLVPSEELASCS